ncbi:MAG: PrgI family protein [Oscillospiraceae bacterium]|nr:PrgI family protein [Oscillospiraceae bacterium]
MLSVAVHKDVSEYQPKIFGKLTSRTLISIVCAIGFSLLSAVYLVFVLKVSVSDNVWLIYAVSIPFWLIGFAKPYGMKFEEFFPAWLRHQLTNGRIMYIPTYRKLEYMAVMEGGIYEKEYKKFTKIKGIEVYRPSDKTLSI